ncbi:MAG TPA: GNAT family N-acetyltransferase [Gammaproteobacteria bacterium]|nr:GNAT family N-acetyltransferase [Gammaproteobacteria bacterium]
MDNVSTKLHHEEPLILRQGARADSPVIANLVESVLREYGLPPDPDNTDADLLDIEASYGQPGRLFVVLENSVGRIVGGGALFELNPQVCELRKMYFSPAIRGQGWGKALLCWLLQEAQRQGYREVHLETASALTEAISLYRCFGFQPACDKPDVARCDQAFTLALKDWKPPEEVRRFTVKI